jgi:phospholipase/carboxylesterase
VPNLGTKCSFVNKKMTTANLSLTHLIRPSRLTEKAPLLLLLHGYGSDENDLFSFASELPKEYIIISAKAPYALAPYGNAWYSINFDDDGGKFNNTEEAIQSRDLILQFIDELIATYPIDASSISLLGFSQGAILSYALSLTYPERIKQVIALSGYIDPEMITGNPLKKNRENLRIYASHGSVDQVIPVTWARKNQEYLKEYGVNFVYEEFPVGHGVSPQNFQRFSRWLSEGKS